MKDEKMNKTCMATIVVFFVCICLAIASLAALTAMTNGSEKKMVETIKYEKVDYREIRREVMGKFDVIDFDCYDQGTKHIEEFYLEGDKGIRVTIDSKTGEIVEVNHWMKNNPEPKQRPLSSELDRIHNEVFKQ